MPVRYRDLDWYRVPRYYDIAFASLTPHEVAFVDALYARYAPTARGRILEPACGSARIAAELAARGYRVTGFDASEPMLAYARRRLARRGLDVDLRRARLESFRYRHRFDLAYCAVSTFKYLLREDDARAHLQAVADHLVRGGVYLLGFHLTDYDDRRGDREVWVGRRGGVEVTCTVDSWPPDRRRRRERCRSRLVVRRGGATERYQTEWEFRTYDAREVRRLLARVPDLEHIDTYDFGFDPDGPVEFGDGQLDHVLVLRKQR